MRRKVKTDMREFIDCYIAFLDLLGFKALLKEKRNDLCEYIAGLFDRIQEDWYITVNKTGEYLIDPALVKRKVMSDSICFYVEASVPNALAGLIATCNYFQVRLSRQDKPVIIRGAIVRGNLYAENDVVFGQGFVDAYLMQEETAKYPRIIMTKELIKQCTGLNEQGLDYIKRFTFDDEDAFVTIDYLYLFYGLSHERDEWKRFAQFVFDRVDAETNASVKEKYLYLQTNIKRAIKKFIDYEENRNA